MWLDNLKAMKEHSGMTTKEISIKSGIPEPTLEKLFAGTTKDPKLATMQQLVHFFGHTLDDLDDSPKKSSIYQNQDAEDLKPEERLHIKKYRLLDPLGKEAVDGVLDVEHRRALEKLKRKQEERSMEASDELSGDTIYFMVPEYSLPMSAGTGQLAENEWAEDLQLIKAPPRGTSYVAHVKGDSMEPTYHDGDLLFVHSTQEIQPGDVGVFLLEGNHFVKELGKGVLISHNSEYDPIPFTENIQCQGLVLGVCDDSYFE